MKWYTLSNNKEVDLIAELSEFAHMPNTILHIGTDAQKNGKTSSDFVTVVCVHMVDECGIGRGGRVLYWKEKQVRTHSLWEKLYGETERSLRVATMLTKEFGFDVGDKILVHVDCNPNVRYASSNYVKTLAGMVTGYGFKYILKPDAFAASHAADHIVKNKN